jgi:hypothetical protein
MKTFPFFSILVLAVLLLGAKGVRAQQAGDDPNWRERGVERLQALQAEIHKLRKELNALQKEQEERLTALEAWMARPTWLDRWDYRPMYPKYRRYLFPHSSVNSFEP